MIGNSARFRALLRRTPSETQIVPRAQRAAVPKRPAGAASDASNQARAELPAELVRRIEFKVLRRLDGFLFGDHTGQFYGPSLDLAEVREYQPGDEVRRIDWYVTARTGQLHVRQYREERELIAWLVVDSSGSMDFGTRRVLKRQLALEFAAATAALMTRRGKVGAVACTPAGLRVTPLGGGRRQSLKIVENLAASAQRAGTETAPPGSFTAAGDLGSALGLVGRSLRRRALVFVVSDFISAEGTVQPAWQRPLTRLALRHDVIAVRVRDPAELELPAVGEVRLRDPESGRELFVDTSDRKVRSAYARLVEERDHATRRALKSSRVDLIDLNTAVGVLDPLVRFAAIRRGRRA